MNLKDFEVKYPNDETTYLLKKSELIRLLRDGHEKGYVDFKDDSKSCIDSFYEYLSEVNVTEDE